MNRDGDWRADKSAVAAINRALRRLRRRFWSALVQLLKFIIYQSERLQGIAPCVYDFRHMRKIGLSVLLFSLCLRYAVPMLDNAGNNVIVPALYSFKK
jgi:hypothetical protein